MEDAMTTTPKHPVMSYWTEEEDWDIDDSLLDSPPLSRGASPREAFLEFEPYFLLSVAQSHHRHHHATSDDDACVQPDILVIIERDAKRETWLWDANRGEIEQIAEGELVDCDERETANAGENVEWTEENCPNRADHANANLMPCPECGHGWDEELAAQREDSRNVDPIASFDDLDVPSGLVEEEKV
jgi:hypothetical protein